MLLEKKKSILEKVRMPSIRDYKDFFQLSSYSTSVIENINHTLTPFPLFSYSLDCPVIGKVQSCSKTLCVFPKLHAPFTTYSKHVLFCEK